MNEPSKHHYIPVFYLKQWAGADGMVCEMRKVRSGLSILRKSPKATSFKRDLYRIDNVPPERAQIFEKAFLSIADNDACKALQKLIHENKNWDTRLRSAWARFIMSILLRNPETVATIRDHILKIWEVGLEVLKSEYSKQPAGNETFEEYFARNHREKPNLDAARFLQSLIDDSKVGGDINSLRWDVVELNQSDTFLLTSDRPIEMPWLGSPDAHIALPIGPRRLFLAARKGDFLLQLLRNKHTDIARQLNKTVVTQAREYVWGFSEAEHAFVDRYMRTAPDRVILSRDQMRQSLEAMQNPHPDAQVT
jgi:hypothetical protein